MRRVTKYLIPFIILEAIAAGERVQAQINIAVIGSWSETIDASDLLAGGAGNDLIDTYFSATDAVSITISETADPSDSWRVDVRKADTNWDSNLTLYVRRTSDGTGGNVSGGTAYQELAGVDQSFFDGSGDVSGINVQLKLTGVSVQVLPDTYITTVHYTVVDISG